MTTRQKPSVRALKSNQQERASRQATIEVLLGRALRGALTIPEAAVLAEYWRAEQRVEEKTRRSLADTTRALERHRAAADTEIQRLEAQVAELSGEVAPEALSARHGAADGSGEAREGRDAPRVPQGRSGDSRKAAA